MVRPFLFWRTTIPWTSRDAKRHTRKANTPKKSRQWAKVADSVLSRGGSEGSAVRQANGVVARNRGRKHARKRR